MLLPNRKVGNYMGVNISAEGKKRKILVELISELVGSLIKMEMAKNE